MKTLFVAPWVPGPLRPRSLAILKLLVPDTELRILALRRTQEDVDAAAVLKLAPTRYVDHPRLPSYFRSGFAALSGRSLQSGYADVPEWRAALREEIREWQPDLVHLNVFRSVPLLSEIDSVPVILDLDEFRSQYYGQLRRDGKGLHRAAGRVEQPRMAAAETSIVNSGVHIMLSGPPSIHTDRPNVHVVRTPVDLNLTASTAPRLDSLRDPKLLFVGRLTYEANVDGLQRFITTIWPTARAAVPSIKLMIVGSDPPRTVRALDGQHGIDVRPNVPDVGAYYEQADIAIVPIWRATGVQMKVIQAASAGVPLVTTPLVAQLAGLRDGEHALIADSASEWRSAIKMLATDAGLRLRLVRGAQAWFEQSHSKAAVVLQLRQAYESALREGGSRIRV